MLNTVKLEGREAIPHGPTTTWSLKVPFLINSLSVSFSQIFFFHTVPPPPILYIADGVQTSQGAEAAKGLKEKKRQ